MDTPLWTERYAPALSELPQPSVRDTLAKVREEPVNLILHGPSGAGKTAAVKALAREVHDDPDNDLTVINVADFFGRTKTEIKNDPRFEPFLVGRSRMSKRDMINHVLKESSSYAPVSGEYKTVLLDNAESIREDFQQALRRVMEQFASNTQFVITTRQPSKLIPPIESRCLPVPVRAPTEAEIVDVLERIVETESIEYDEGGLQFVAAAADGDLREAILSTQTVARQADAVTMETAFETLGEVGYEETVEGMLEAAENGEFKSARKTLDSLLNDEGLDGEEVLSELLAAGRDRHEGDERALAHLHRRAADVDLRLQEGVSARTQLSQLLAELGEG
jgi:replication factor C small subunit